MGVFAAMLLVPGPLGRSAIADDGTPNYRKRSEREGIGFRGRSRLDDSPESQCD